VEASAYGFSLVTSTFTTAAALAGASWEGVLLKMIQTLKHTTAESRPVVELGGHGSQGGQAAPVAPKSEGLEPRPSLTTSEEMMPAAGSDRQAWDYAVLFKPLSRPFPGFLALTKGSSAVISSVDASRYFPLDERVLIGSGEYHFTAYDAATRTIRLGMFHMAWIAL
jgi:hypothetical protein